MKLDMKKTMLLVLATVATFSVSAQNEELWLDKYEVQSVIDTAAADSLDVVANARYNARKKDDAYQRFRSDKKSLFDKIDIINKLIEAEKNELVLAESKWIPGTFASYMEPTSYENRELYSNLCLFKDDENTKKSDVKSIKKGKVPKGFTERVLLPAKAKIEEQIGEFVPPAEEKHYDWRKGSNRNIPQKKIQVKTRIPNPECRDNYFNGNIEYDGYKNHRWDEAQQSKGWEWANSDEMEDKQVFFPSKISYLVHPSHTEYRFKFNYNGFNAYDTLGNLVRVDNIIGENVRNDIHEKVMMTICKRDFLANKYDINKAEEKTLNVLRSKLGVKKTDKARKVEAEIGKGLSNAIEKGESARLEKGQAVTKKEREKAAKKERDAVNQGVAYLFMALASSMDEKADNYIEQLKSDHRNDLNYLYKIERIDNTTFKLYYLNNKMECSCVALMKWFSTAPYMVESDSYEIELLPDETIAIRR